MRLNINHGAIAAVELAILSGFAACSPPTPEQARATADKIETVTQPLAASAAVAVPPPWGVPISAAIIAVGHLSAELFRAWAARANTTRPPRLVPQT